MSPPTKRHKHVWKEWYLTNRLPPDMNYNHPPDTIVTYKSEAKVYYRLTDDELSTLAHVELESSEGRKTVTYDHAQIQELVYRKYAMLSGENPMHFRWGANFSKDTSRRGSRRGRRKGVNAFYRHSLGLSRRVKRFPLAYIPAVISLLVTKEERIL
ncbi:hypothetical protein B0H19DRAFT_1237620 [Mycena capillaripes]|nr:hypothetical protein B0H19DRAFT_1237620 [Mycena capillaripes]